MWLFLLFSLTAADNRVADKFFFGNTATYRTFLPALPCNKEFPWYIKNIPCGSANPTRENIYPLKNTAFRITFNPFRCDTLNHVVAIALVNKYESKQGRVADQDRLQFNVKDYLVLQRVTIMGEEQPNEITYKILMKDRRPLLIDFTVKAAHMYVKIDGGTMNVTFFEENSDNTRMQQTIRVKDIDTDLHYFAIIASEYDTCPTFISMVDSNFPKYVAGMPWDINGTANNKIDWGDTAEASYTHMYATFFTIFVAGVIYICVVPILLHFVYPELRYQKQRMQELLEDDDNMVTLNIVRAAVAFAPPAPLTDDQELTEFPSREDGGGTTTPRCNSKLRKGKQRKSDRQSKIIMPFKKASKRSLRGTSTEALLKTQPSDENVHKNNNVHQLKEEPTQQGNEEPRKSLSRRKQNTILKEEITQQLMSDTNVALSNKKKI